MLEKFSLRQNVSFDCNFMMAFIRILNYIRDVSMYVYTKLQHVCKQLLQGPLILTKQYVTKKGFGCFKFFSNSQNYAIRKSYKMT